MATPRMTTRAGGGVAFRSETLASTSGLRGRIALAVLLGLLALAIGITRFVFLGQFLVRLFRGAPAAQLVLPLVGARRHPAAPRLDHVRTMVAHRTAARVQDSCAAACMTRSSRWVRRGSAPNALAASCCRSSMAWSSFRRSSVSTCRRCRLPLRAAGDFRLYRVLGRAGRRCDAGGGAVHIDGAGGGARAHQRRIANAADRVQGVRRGVP